MTENVKEVSELEILVKQLCDRDRAAFLRLVAAEAKAVELRERDLTLGVAMRIFDRAGQAYGIFGLGGEKMTPAQATTRAAQSFEMALAEAQQIIAQYKTANK